MDLLTRAKRHAALGDPVRLRLVDDLITTDRSPSELGTRYGLPSNLLAHHLLVLEESGLIERLSSSGDARRRYVRLRHESFVGLGFDQEVPVGPVLFICTHNSARSQLAAALWSRRFGTPATSAGTHPADRVHPGAVQAAERVGLDLSDARPQPIDAVAFEPQLVVTVCDRAHEELDPDESWWHWSTPDPVDNPERGSFDTTLERLSIRISTLTP